MTGEAGDRGRDGCCQTENGQFVEMSQIDVITDFFFYPSSGIFPFGSPKNKKQKTKTKNKKQKTRNKEDSCILLFWHGCSRDLAGGYCL